MYVFCKVIHASKFVLFCWKKNNDSVSCMYQINLENKSPLEPDRFPQKFLGFVE